MLTQTVVALPPTAVAKNLDIDNAEDAMALSVWSGGKLWFNAGLFASNQVIQFLDTGTFTSYDASPNWWVVKRAGADLADAPISPEDYTLAWQVTT